MLLIKKLSLLIVFIFLLILVSGCTQVLDECFDDSDCRGFKCSHGECTDLECFSDPDCDSNQLCESGKCISSNVGECNSDNECGLNQECKDSKCVSDIQLETKCETNTDCDDSNSSTIDICQYQFSNTSFCQNFNKANIEGLKCESVLTNGDPETKIDIVFISDGFSPENINTFNENVLSQIDAGGVYQGRTTDGLLSLEPFKSKSHRFNFWKVKYYDGFDCKYETRPLECSNYEAMLSVASTCPYDYPIVITNTHVSQGAGGTPTLSSLYIPTTLHEFGHTFGFLGDEYNQPWKFDGEPGQPIEDYDWLKNLEQPNIDVAGCPKWCSNYIPAYSHPCTEIKNETACRRYNRELTEYGYSAGFSSNNSCVWFNQSHPYFESNCVPVIDYKNIGLNCFEDTGCYFGAYYGQLLWRSYSGEVTNVDSSIMHSLSGNLGYGKLNEQHLTNVIDCCYPESCSSFPSKCQEFASKNPLFSKCSVCN